MKKFAMVAAAFALAASATGAFAEGDTDGNNPVKGPRKFIEALDTNNDGRVDAAEFSAGAAARAAKRFDAIDTDGKGVITRDQFVKAAELEAARRFERTDRNGDGALTEEDRPARGEHREGKHKGGHPPEADPAPVE
jgi:Ca2+-binding EF-hand superfamily protein